MVMSAFIGLEEDRPAGVNLEPAEGGGHLARGGDRAIGQGLFFQLLSLESVPAEDLGRLDRAECRSHASALA